MFEFICSKERLHYVPGGYGSHVSDDGDQNGINAGERDRQISGGDSRGHRGIYDSLKICHGNHGGNEKRNCVVIKWPERNTP